MTDALKERAERFKREWLMTPRIHQLDEADLVEVFSEVYAEGLKDERTAVVEHFRAIVKDIRESRLRPDKKKGWLVELIDNLFEGTCDGLADFLARGGHLDVKRDGGS